ncbi:MAG: orotidine-5'-phosphate decarboxylase [Promicromonosporaceae bacterium]|nr:orotidine-5'-phosphate decarboxylase [Promicromonosporaceae bacterium]
MDTFGPLCVGIDPHPSLLAAWGLPDDVMGLREFSLGVVAALGGHVAALKPQAAFYERHGSAGIAVLEETLAAARRVGTLTIVDAKRGDIGSTMTGYAEAYLRDGSPLAGDALTVSPYLGFGSLRPAIDLALETGRGLFVLCLTSNPEGASVQHAHPSGSCDSLTLAQDDVPPASFCAERSGVAEPRTVAAAIAVQATAINEGADPLGSIGLVVGATVGEAATNTGTNLVEVNGPLLAPGVGAQGAGPVELAQVFGPARRNVLASSSRAVLAAGPSLTALRAAAQQAAIEARTALR